MDSETFQKLEGIIRTVLKKPALELTEASRALDVPGWDSMANVMIMMSIQKEFKIRISAGELLRLKNVGDLHNLIQSKLGTS